MQILFENGVATLLSFLSQPIFSGVAEYIVVKNHRNVVKKTKFFKENHHVL